LINFTIYTGVITVTGKGTITYTYDAAGNKLKKEINETGQPLKTTLYIGGAVPIAIGMKTMCCSSSAMKKEG
jgi:YD repeat-containing protein